MRKDFTYPSTNGKTQIHAIEWRPDGEIKAVLQIAHGMAEYIDRYESFASRLNEHGILVVGNDHLGHGKSINSEDELGYFAEKDGNKAVLEDMHTLTQLIKKENPNVPYFLMGHSMGSFYTRQYIGANNGAYGRELSGAIVMATNYQAPFVVGAGKFLTRVIALFHGWNYRSKFVDSISFGANNKKFEPARTELEWLTRDPKVIDEYIADDLCGFNFTLNGFYGMFDCLAKTANKKFVRQMPKELPVLFLAGTDDPVGAFGEGVKRVAKMFKDVGMEDVQLELYEGQRHELLNELDNEKVYEDILSWLDAKMN